MIKKSLVIVVLCLGVGIFFFVSENPLDNATANSDKSRDRVLFSVLNIDKLPGKTHLDARRNDAGNPESQPGKSDEGTTPFSQTVENQLLGEKKVDVESTLGEAKPSLALWEPRANKNESGLEAGTSEVYEEEIQTDTEALVNLQVGQVVEFFVPQLGETFQSEIDSTSNQLGNVKVWKGKIQDGEDNSNFIMTQGETMTHVVLATTKGIYTAYIDNDSGEGAIVDDREYSQGMTDTDDSVPFHYDTGEE